MQLLVVISKVLAFELLLLLCGPSSLTCGLPDRTHCFNNLSTVCALICQTEKNLSKRNFSFAILFYFVS